MSSHDVSAIETAYQLTPEQERKRIKRLIRQGELPRYSVEKVVIGSGPKARTELRLVDTIAKILGKTKPASSLPLPASGVAVSEEPPSGVSSTPTGSSPRDDA